MTAFSRAFAWCGDGWFGNLTIYSVFCVYGIGIILKYVFININEKWWVCIRVVRYMIIIIILWHRRIDVIWILSRMGGGAKYYF